VLDDALGDAAQQRVRQDRCARACPSRSAPRRSRRARDDLGVGRPTSIAVSQRRPASRTRFSSARSPSVTRSITWLMSIGTVATSMGGGSANDASTAT
jgi:hypothetical protein